MLRSGLRGRPGLSVWRWGRQHGLRTDQPREEIARPPVPLNKVRKGHRGRHSNTRSSPPASHADPSSDTDSGNDAHGAQGPTRKDMDFPSRGPWDSGPAPARPPGDVPRKPAGWPPSVPAGRSATLSCFGATELPALLARGRKVDTRARTLSSVLCCH